MRTLAIAVVLSLGACAASREGRTPPVPRGLALPPVDMSRSEGMRTAADRSPPPPGSDLPTAGRTGSLRTMLLPSEMGAPAEQSQSQPQSQTNAQPEQAPPVWQHTAGDRVEYDYGYGYGYDYGYWYPERVREPWIPVNTVIGASFGAAYDATRCCGHGHHGALVGAGIGLAIDLGHLFCR